MPRKKTQREIVRLVKKGRTVAQVRDKIDQDIKWVGVERALNEAIGSGKLMVSDFYFAAPEDVRQGVERLADTGSNNDEIMKKAADEGWDKFNVQAVLKFRDTDAFRGDLYRYLSDIELSLFEHVQNILMEAYGVGEDNWWAEGVPVSVRTKCATRREEDPDRLEPWRYQDLLDLSKTIEKNWKFFKHTLPKYMRANRSRLLRGLSRLNRIRNAVMHPVKKRSWSRDDFAFVRKFRDQLTKQGFRELPESPG